MRKLPQESIDHLDKLLLNLHENRERAILIERWKNNLNSLWLSHKCDMPDELMFFARLVMNLYDVFIDIILAKCSVAVIRTVPRLIFCSWVKNLFAPSVHDPHIIVCISDAESNESIVHSITIRCECIRDVDGEFIFYLQTSEGCINASSDTRYSKTYSVTSCITILVYRVLIIWSRWVISKVPIPVNRINAVIGKLNGWVNHRNNTRWLNEVGMRQTVYTHSIWNG